MYYLGQQTLESVLDVCSPRRMVCPCDSKGVKRISGGTPRVQKILAFRRSCEDRRTGNDLSRGTTDATIQFVPECSYTVLRTAIRQRAEAGRSVRLLEIMSHSVRCRMLVNFLASVSSNELSNMKSVIHSSPKFS